MKGFNELILVAVTGFSGTTTPDKNGKMPIMLQLLAGTMPNRNVLSGTVAERIGIEAGKSYILNCRQAGTDLDFGDDFTFIKVDEVKGLDIIKSAEVLGKPQLITIERPEGFEDKYERKSDAVEGIRTVRAKEGKYIRLGDSPTPSHATADDVKEGTSNESNVDLGLGRVEDQRVEQEQRQ